MRVGALLTLFILSTQALSGCFGNDEPTPAPVDDSPFYFNTSETTWYHYPGAINANNASLGFGNLGKNKAMHSQSNGFQRDAGHSTPLMPERRAATASA
mgnify:CR=1 FL=1